MTTDPIAEFLMRMAEDKELRETVAEVAGRHGIQFAADESLAADCRRASDRISGVQRKVTIDDLDDEGAPGFGIIEVPA